MLFTGVVTVRLTHLQDWPFFGYDPPWCEEVCTDSALLFALQLSALKTAGGALPCKIEHCHEQGEGEGYLDAMCIFQFTFLKKSHLPAVWQSDQISSSEQAVK